MTTTIHGKNIAKEMKGVAKEYLSTYPKAGCVCVGVRMHGGSKASGRAKSGGERHAYVGVSGDDGRKLLRTTLLAEGAVPPATTANGIVGMLTDMAGQLVEYRSKKDGSSIRQVENWSTHNCAESNLALYLYKMGVDFKHVTLASYESSGSAVRFKPLCHNCQQWTRQHFSILPEYKSSAT